MKQLRLNTSQELIVDLFAGGGGASLGIEWATGRMVDIAINHDPEAIAMHMANHPTTRHLTTDVREIDPMIATRGQPVGLLWASPDCKHHSKAKGGKPREAGIRSLAWVVIRWAKTVKPRVIVLENVEEFRDWCPLDAEGQPIKTKKGQTFDIWKQRLEHQGYRVEWRELRACDYGAPTIRKRLFVIARRDGLPISYPAPSHFDPKNRHKGRVFNADGKEMRAWRVAAECIDWSIPCPSIFDRARPLADATCRRIAKGIVRYVIEAQEPFLVYDNRAPILTECANASSPRSNSAQEPLRTICAQPKGGHHALVVAFLSKYYGGKCTNPAASLNDPAPTITAIDHNSLCAAHIVKLRNNGTGQDMREPLHTIAAGGEHFAQVRAFLVKYYGSGDADPLDDPMHTVTTLDRFALVTVHGEAYAIADIGLRMLAPRELFRAQGFPDEYIIDRGADGRTLTKTAQVRMVGNSVCPPVAAALVAANYREIELERAA
jgi:DNA (cytosine-5)-methyltransferase 1